MYLAGISAGFALLVAQTQDLAPVTEPGDPDGYLPVPVIVPDPPPIYRMIARIDEDQGAEAAIFLQDKGERAPHLLAVVLVVPLRKTHKYKSGQPSHGRFWYEISCEQRAMRIVRARIYDPGDRLLQKHDQSFSRPMVGALPDDKRFPDLIVQHACGPAAGGVSFDEALAAIAYARTGSAPR